MSRMPSGTASGWTTTGALGAGGRGSSKCVGLAQQRRCCSTSVRQIRRHQPGNWRASGLWAVLWQSQEQHLMPGLPACGALRVCVCRGYLDNLCKAISEGVKVNMCFDPVAPQRALDPRRMPQRCGCCADAMEQQYNN